MAEESFMLVSLRENKAKKLAQVISNETSRKILGFLAQKEYAESELAKAMQVPISTVHYNLQHLIENKLVVAEEFHYSQKGKEVMHYRLANKLIIIAPENTDSGLMEKLRALLPVGILTAAAAFALNYYSKLQFSSFSAGEDLGRTASPMAAQMAKVVADESVLTASTQATDSLQQAAAINSGTTLASSSLSGIFSSITAWFLIGA